MNKFMDCINAGTVKEFTMIPHALLRDSNVSFKAKGILSLLLSNKQGWKSYKSVMTTMSKDGKDSIENGLKELERNGYLKRFTLKDKKQRYAGSFWAYTDVKDDFNINLSIYTKEGFTVTEKAVIGKADTKKNKDNNNNDNKKKSTSVSFQATRESLQDYLNRDLTEKELTSIRLNIYKNIDIDALISSFNFRMIEECIDVLTLDQDAKIYGINIVGFIYMYYNDIEKFEEILKGIG